MNLHDSNFMSFDGEPITGRVPPRLEVVGNDGVLTPQQRAGVAHAYKLFCDAKRVSLGEYLTQHRTLADGTQVTMTSINGVDQVQVSPPRASSLVTLKDLFFALPGYLQNVGYPPYDPKFSGAWEFRGKNAAPTKLKPMRQQVDLPGLAQHPGNLTWWSTNCKANGKPMVLSWYGRGTRYGRFDYFGRQHRQQCVGVIEYQRLYSPAASRQNWKDAFKPAVWLNGVKHAVAHLVVGVSTALPVMSAGLKKEAGGLYLYLVSYKTSNRLAVYKGKISPLTASTVMADELFEIDFQIESTVYATAHPSDPQWETLLQPLYFNGSCTACAGLVSVLNGSAVNTVAAATISQLNPTDFARLIQVAIVAQTTSFAGTDASFTQSVTDPVVGPVVLTQTRYAAVDYMEDQLLVAMTKLTTSSTITMTGTAYTPGNMSDHVMTQTVETSYRAFFLHDNFTLAQKSTGPVYVGDLSTTAAAEVFPGQPNGTGVRTEYLSALLYLGCSIEGGDLRHRAPTVFEAIEIGTSQWEVDFSYHDHMTVTSTVVNARQRKLSGRFSVWKDGVEIETGPYWDNTATGGTSALGLATSTIANFPYGGTFTNWTNFGYGEFPATSLSGFDLPGSFNTGTNPWYDTGWPYVNTSAFSADETYWFYDIGAFFADNSFTWGTTFSGLFGIPTQNPIAAFMISGVKHLVVMLDIVPEGNGAFSSPVFINQVPDRIS